MILTRRLPRPVQRLRKGVVALLLLLATLPALGQGEIYLDDRDNYAQVASDYFQRENWDAGKKVIDEGLRRYPKDSDLRMLLGKYFYQIGNYDAARYELLKALEYDKHNVEAKQILVNVEVITQRYSSAICYVNELLEVNPYWKGLWKKKIEIHRLEGNNVEANRLLKRLSQIYPDDKDLRTTYTYYIEQEITTRKKEGKFTDVIKLTTQLIEEDPFNEELHLELINACLKYGDYEGALMYTEKGLYNLPYNVKLIDKKTDILAYLNRYDEAMGFIRLKMRDGQNVGHLQQRYNYFLEESARHSRMSDPYTLYSTLFERNPRNEEAFNYVYANALARGFYDDALAAVNRVKAVRGEDKALLSKEQHVLESMGAQSKADQVTVRMYELYPDDVDVEYQYANYMMREARLAVQDELYDKAIKDWGFVVDHGDASMKKAALTSLFNINYQQGRYDQALETADRLLAEYPDEWEWHTKKALVYGQQGDYTTSLAQYDSILQTVPLSEASIATLRSGYDELAAGYTKKLIEAYELDQAKELVDHWLEINPGSELGLLYAANIAGQMRNYQQMGEYAQLQLDEKPDDVLARIKLGQSYHAQKELKAAYDELTPELPKHPYHKDLITAYSQFAGDYAQALTKEDKYDESLAVLDNALRYDPDNKNLKYLKSEPFDKKHEYDSAYYYAKFYQPTIADLYERTDPFRSLRVRTFKNQVGFSHLRSRYGHVDEISAVSSVEYLRMQPKNTYTGRINYTGRDDGKGLQLEGEWMRTWRPDLYSRAGIGFGTRYFPYFMIGGSVYKTFKETWEAEAGLGYRYTADNKNLFTVPLGISKEWDPWRVSLRFNNVLLDSKYYYSLLMQGQYSLPSARSYIIGMASFGSAPDVDVIDYELYNGFSVTNSMVGLGGRYLLSDAVTLGLMGNWYNYEDSENKGTYLNLFNLFFQIHVSF